VGSWVVPYMYEELEGCACSYGSTDRVKLYVLYVSD
jgi:hypothetical protein